MTGIHRFIVIAAIGNMAIYVPCFLLEFIRAVAFDDSQPLSTLMVVWHLVGMFLNLLGLIETIRDLYSRQFPNPNSKVTWCLLILMTGGIGWFAYVARHGLRPRPDVVHENAS